MHNVMRVVLLFVLSVSVWADEFVPIRIEVFVLSHEPVEGIDHTRGVTVYALDAVDQWKRTHFPVLSDTPRSAAGQVRTVLENLAELDKASLQRAWQGLLKAHRYGLERIPAIVLNDGKSVIYGTTDVNLAVTQWRRWKNAGND